MQGPIAGLSGVAPSGEPEDPDAQLDVLVRFETDRRSLSKHTWKLALK